MRKLHAFMFCFILFGLGAIGFLGSTEPAGQEPVDLITQAYSAQRGAAYIADGSLPSAVLTIYNHTGNMDPGLLTATDYVPTFEADRSGADCLARSFAFTDLKVANPHSARDSLSWRGVSC